MTIQEAYNKGLDDAESVAITKLLNTLNGVDDPFLNPKFEEVRQAIKTKLEVVPCEEVTDKARILKILNSVLKGTPSRLAIKDPEFEDFRQRLQTIMGTIYGMTQKRTSFAKQMRKILKQNTVKTLTSDEEVVN